MLSICLTLCLESGGSPPLHPPSEMPLIFTAESQGLEQHWAQSGCSGSDHLGYTLQTPSGTSPSTDRAHQPPRKMLDPFLQGALMTGEGIRDGPGENTRPWAPAKSNIRELKKINKKREKTQLLSEPVIFTWLGGQDDFEEWAVPLLLPAGLPPPGVGWGWGCSLPQVERQ